MAPADHLRHIAEWDLDEHVLIVAEIGNNHEGDPSVAEELIRRAAEAGVGAVKFQAIVPEALVGASEHARIEQLHRLCLPLTAFERLAEVAEVEGLLFLCTPFDHEAVRVLEPLVPAYKVASGDLTFTPLLEAVAATGKPVLLATGMADVTEIESALATLDKAAPGEHASVALLHCVSSYPTVPDEANLGALRQLADLGRTLGYSDHTVGVQAAVLSVALGARLIEKHFTLANDYSEFRDHAVSADPRTMTDLVALVRETEVLLGDGLKRCMPSEESTARAARRSIGAARDLEPGHIVIADDLVWLRPGDGLSAEDVIGRRVVRSVAARMLLGPADLA